MRSLKDGRPWLLLEQAPSAVSWRDVNVPKAPGQMRIGSLQAIAHGSDGAMCFQWRQAKYGQEKFHSAMVGHRGEASRTFQEAKAFGAELQRLEPVRGSRVRSRVALVIDHDSWWGSSAAESLPSQRLEWLTQARAWNAALFALGHPVDAVQATSDLTGYDVVVVPNLYVTDGAQAAAFAAFVERGGQLVVGPFSGVVDATEKVHDGGAPGPLRGLLGVEVDEQWPVADGRAERVAFGGGHAEFDAPIWGEWLDVHPGTEVFAGYASGELDGRPAITRRPTSAEASVAFDTSSSSTGEAWYVSCVLEPAGLVELFRAVLGAAGLPARERTHADLEAVTRSDETTDYTFLLNHGRDELVVDVPEGARDLLGDPDGLDTLAGARYSTGGTFSTGGRATLTLPRFGAAVFATPRAGAAPFITRSDIDD
jgi:beta-galactosidase